MTYYIDIDDILANNHIYSADVRQALIDLDQKLFNIITGVDTITAPSSQTMKITAPSNKTIAAGVLTPTASSHDVVSESSTTDDLVTIAAASNTQLLFLRASTGHTITVIHGIGNIKTSGLQNVTLNNSKFLMLVGVGSYWYVVNAGGDHAHSTADINNLTEFVDGRVAAGATGGFTTVLLTEVAEPSTPSSGTAYVYADTSGQLHSKNDAGLVLNVGFPVGIMLPFPSTTPPSGWLLCNGQAVSRTTYAQLWTVCSSGGVGKFGNGDGSTTFNLPDLRGRVPMGMDDMATGGAANRVTDAQADVIGGVMGAQTHTLSTTELAAHTHGTTWASGGAPEALRGYGIANNGATPAAGPATNSQGGGAAHNNMQPSIALPYIIKY